MQTFPIGSQVWCFTRTPSAVTFTLGTIRRRIEDADGMHFEIEHMDEEGDRVTRLCVARDLYPAASSRTPTLSAERLGEVMQDIALEAQFCALGRDDVEAFKGIVRRSHDGTITFDVKNRAGYVQMALKAGLISDGGEGVGYELTALGLAGARLVLP